MWQQIELNGETAELIGQPIATADLIQLSHIHLNMQCAAHRRAEFSTSPIGSVVNWAGLTWQRVS